MAGAGEIPSPNSAAEQSRVLVCADKERVAQVVAERFVRLSQDCIAAGGVFHVALAGGKTPRRLYQLLGSEEFRGWVNWSAVHLFWGDERCVPPEHPESSYGMVRRELLSKLSIPQNNVHRMEAERADVEQAARDYEKLLQQLLPHAAQGVPRFDLVLLGLGADGHTASLVPEWKEWREAAGYVAVPPVLYGGVRRMTLTLPVLNAAQRVIFMVTGSAKAGILRRVIIDGDQSLPAQWVRPDEGEFLFIVDAEAAARLNEAAR